MTAKDRTEDIEALRRADATEFDAQLTKVIEKLTADGAEVLQAETVFAEDLAHGAFLSAGAWPDAAGNIFQWIVLNNPDEYSTQAVTYVRYVTPDEETVLAETIVLNAEGRKADSVTAIQVADKLVIYPTGHALVSGPRTNGFDRAVWNVGAVPYGPGEKPKTGVSAPPMPSEQVFADVPPEHPMYAYIQHMATVGAIGGYPCGGAMEPCDPQQRPYFRPGQTATRGQIAKMIAVATGFVP